MVQGNFCAKYMCICKLQNSQLLRIKLSCLDLNYLGHHDWLKTMTANLFYTCTCTWKRGFGGRGVVVAQ